MARTYGYYRILTWCLALVPAGSGFFLLLAMVTLVVAIPWQCLKPNPLKKLDEKKLVDEINLKRSVCGRCIPSCSWSDMLKLLLKGVLQITERCSHYLFENDSLKIQSNEEHGRIVIISGRTFKLSFKVLFFLVVYNCIVWGIIFSVAMNYLVLHETSYCNDNYDCFVGKDTAYSAQPLTNCSEIRDNNSVIKCYYIEIRPAVVIALVGGFLKIVPPMVFYATTTLYLILLKDCHLSIKIAVNLILFVIFSGLLVMILVFTGLRPIAFIYKNDERAAQVFVFVLLCLCFTCWPWYVFECAQVNLEEGDQDERDHEEEEEAAGANNDSGSQEQLCSGSYKLASIAGIKN
uniref:Uncharacterized protein n=1 Tax=Amphimedon queenslandica TaxID=400682 RepID=A0A1X7SYZ9_AMPQE